MLYQPGQRPPIRKPLPFINWSVIRDEWLKPALTALLLVAVINLFFPRYFVQGRSMEPSLHEDDRLLVSSIDRMTGTILRGEVIVLNSPVDGERVVKRVIGLPGDVVQIEDGHVFINGQLLDEPYINKAPTYAGIWTISADQYFVLGDNRNHSYDSADYGPVPESLIQGVVKLRFWPPTDLLAFGLPQYDETH